MTRNATTGWNSFCLSFGSESGDFAPLTGLGTDFTQSLNATNLDLVSTVAKPADAADKVVLAQWDADTEDLVSGHAIAIIYSEAGKDGLVLPTFSSSSTYSFEVRPKSHPAILFSPAKSLEHWGFAFGIHPVKHEEFDVVPIRQNSTAGILELTGCHPKSPPRTITPFCCGD